MDPETQQAPPVVAVVVVHDPGPWFDTTMATLAAQDYPNVRMLFLVADGEMPFDDVQQRIRSALPDALLLVPAFAGVDRVTARMGATRRDRLTAPLPMLRRPHPEGLVGAVRVEVRGRVGLERRVVVLGASERPAVAAGAMAATAALRALRGELPAGSCGLASAPDPLGLLREVASRGVRLSRFEGVSTFR